MLSAGPAVAATSTYSNSSGVSIDDAKTAASTTPIAISTGAPAPASPYPATLNVNGVDGHIFGLTVTLTGVSHTFPDDLDVLLVGPAGQHVILMSDAGGGLDVNNVNLTFDKNASTSLPDSTQITAGTYQPTNYVGNDGATDVWPAPAPPAAAGDTDLGVFNGTDPNGTWSLFVNDDLSGDGGSIQGWSLGMTTDATTRSAPYPSTVNVSGSGVGITDVNLVLHGFTHHFPSDVDMLLVGPHGQMAKVFSDVGSGTPVSALDITLDDEAPLPLPGVLTSGTFRPTDQEPGDPMPAPAPNATGAAAPLSVFDGTDPNGTWSLYIADDSSNDAGSLAGWSLQIGTLDGPVITAPATGGRDRDGAFTVVGTAPAGSTVTLRDGATAKATAAATATGAWVVTLAGLRNGTHVLTAVANDAIGNVSPASPAVTIIVDSVKPSIVSTVPANKAKHASTTANVTAKTSEAVRKLTVIKDNAFIVVAGTTTHLKAKVTWNAGTHRIVINPKANLDHGTTYKVTITTKVLDLAGNPLDQNKSKAGVQKKTWKFTTK
jgi:subtilisin-like proprotein convertase family protein